jgi:hypothetical protein
MGRWPAEKEGVTEKVPASHESVLLGYLEAYGRVVGAGYAKDIHWADDLGSVKPDAAYVVCEGSWVILNSGFRFAVAQKLWPRLREAFHNFEPDAVDASCLPAARLVLGHEGKIGAMVRLAEIVRAEGAEKIVEDAKDPPRLMRLPYIGKITCWHLAKVLGADVVKPDVHLQRAAAAAGFPSALALCEAIRDASRDRLTVVDSVLWRYGEQQKARGWPDWETLLTRPPNTRGAEPA